MNININNIICIFLIAVGTCVLMTPVLRYICYGWLAKRKDIMDGLNDDARQAYFEMFSRGSETPKAGNASKAFEDFHFKWYGRKYFAWPTLLLFLVSVSAVTLVTLTCLKHLGFTTYTIFELPNTAMAALGGAYLWVVDDHVSRARRLDFAPSDVHWGTLRLVIAIPMGYGFGALLSPGFGPFVSFALGAFPLDALLVMLRRLSEKQLGLGNTDAESSDDITKLQGINKMILDRLRNEDISTVTQMAYCDPVRLVMRANLDFVFVCDCMNQALAWLYFEGKLAVIRPFGLRGAVEIKNFINELDFDTKGNTDAMALANRDRAVAALPAIAAALQMDVNALQVPLREIAADPYTDFLSRIWG
ncbi:hypothetical protein [Rhodoferax sp. GW822-FHT02A01]|uniref:hypothetical protein n=1 Tax=Rhodoferax sp. GW822-FHT02A01 TaxID=3141537 RepID=UPI00315CBDDF